jgi:hypothetical protein
VVACGRTAPGMLGMWLTHDPADFGLAAIVPPPPAALAGSMRTGLTEALLTDAEDDSYDLSWLHRLPSDALAAVRELRRLRHNAEMDGIRAALLAKFGKVPVLETYRQMAIRRQKAKDWQQAIWWVERGLALYGEQAARPPGIRRRPAQATDRVPGQVDDTDETPTEGGAEPARRARQPDDRGPRVRDLWRELRSRRGPWSEAKELPRLPPTRAHGRRRRELTDMANADGLGHTASQHQGSTAQVG